MFYVKHIESELEFKVYAVRTDILGTHFLLHVNKKWKWVHSDAFIPN